MAIRRRPTSSAVEDTKSEPEEEAPRRTRYDEDEEEAPRRRRPTASSSSDDEEEEDPAPSAKDVVASGWGAFDKAKKSSGDFAAEVKLDKEPQLFKFLEDAPFSVYKQHWLDGRSGKKSFTCLVHPETGIGKCPLCDTLGDDPRTFIAFNVLLIDGENVENQVLVCGVRLAKQLEDLNKDPKTGPLTAGYYAMSRSGKGTQTSYNVHPIKERDLRDDWDTEPLTDAELDELYQSSWDADKFPTRTSANKLREIALEMAN